MEYNEAFFVLENSLRCLAMSMEKFRDEFAYYHYNYNPVIRDRLDLDFNTEPNPLYNAETCLKYLKNMTSILRDCVTHESKSCDMNPDLVILVDCIENTIVHEFPPVALQCATRLKELANRLMPDCDLDDEPSMSQSEYINKFLEEANPILSSCGYEQLGDSSEVRLNLFFWARDKYSLEFE